MKCEELLAVLNEYVDGAIDPSVCHEFEPHRTGCNPCRIVVDNVRQTITLYQEGKPCGLPMAFREQWHAVLRGRWSQNHSQKPLLELSLTRRTRL
jgi:hypothetical protein